VPDVDEVARLQKEIKAVPFRFSTANPIVTEHFVSKHPFLARSCHWQLGWRSGLDMAVVNLASRCNSMALTPTDLESMLSEFDGIHFEEKVLEFTTLQIHNLKRQTGSIPAHFSQAEKTVALYELTDTKIRISDSKLRDVAVAEVLVFFA